MDEPSRVPAPCFFTVTELLMAWTALREGQIRLKELRVYFALAVLKRAAGRAQGKAVPPFTLRDVRALVGAPGGEHSAARQLVAVGLLRAVSKTHIEFATDPKELRFEPQTLDRALDLIPQHLRLVPVPREIVRLMASGVRRSLIATILGHLICCPKRGASGAEGYVKASWVGQVFGISEKIVKVQRRRLVALGLLLPRSTSQRTLNLHGGCYAINLGWNGSRHGSLSPSPVVQEPSLATPESLPG